MENISEFNFSIGLGDKGRKEGCCFETKCREKEIVPIKILGWKDPTKQGIQQGEIRGGLVVKK